MHNPPVSAGQEAGFQKAGKGERSFRQNRSARMAGARVKHFGIPGRFSALDPKETETSERDEKADSGKLENAMEHFRHGSSCQPRWTGVGCAVLRRSGVARAFFHAL